MPGDDLPQSVPSAARTPPPRPPPLGAGAIHVWTVAAGGDAAGDLALLDAAERARAARFVRAADRAGFVRAHAAVRRVLAGYAGGDPAALAFAEGPWGKPALSGPAAAAGLAFNLTHSGGCVLIAVARARAVGIDVEAMRPRADAAAIARRMIGEAAAAALAGLDGTARDEVFLRWWTAQEAAIKALGSALAVGRAAAQVALSAGRPGCVWADPALAPFGLGMAALPAPPGHVATLAWARTAADEPDPAIVQVG
jgi:4'-phosphopantetheinyl transferase